MEKILSVKLPEDVFQKLHRIANFTQKTVSDVIVNTVNATFISPNPPLAPISDELAAMHQMKDTALWDALNPSVTVQQQQRLQTLSTLSGQRPLSQAEINEQEKLLMEHHRSVLRRAQAIAVLSLRGYVVSDEFLRQRIV